MNSQIPMSVREDNTSEKNKYYLAKYRSPMTLDLSKGVAFLLFISESGYEELQIAPLYKDNLNLSRFEQKDNKVKLRLYRRKDAHGKIYYVGKLKMNALVSFEDGGSFIAWVWKTNAESLQVEGKFTMLGGNSEILESNDLTESFDEDQIGNFKGSDQ